MGPIVRQTLDTSTREHRLETKQAGVEVELTESETPMSCDSDKYQCDGQAPEHHTARDLSGCHSMKMKHPI